MNNKRDSSSEIMTEKNSEEEIRNLLLRLLRLVAAEVAKSLAEREMGLRTDIAPSMADDAQRVGPGADGLAVQEVEPAGNDVAPLP